jgi:5'-methylthioadenosine phosphorylase
MQADVEERVPIGIIGGSGLYDIDEIEIQESRAIETPFGEPSADVRIGEYEGRRVAFIPRHGDEHVHNPTEVPYRANIWALKSLGVFWLVSVSAVGSLRENIEPGECLVVPDQIIDKTFNRANTFFEDLAVHVGLSRPYHPMIRDVLSEAIEKQGLNVRSEATYVCMEGPAFSTKAESTMHRQWGADLVGMTAMPEARFAREAEMCYGTIALPTDYDVWYEDREVEVNDVVEIVQQNVANVKKVLKDVISMMPLEREDECSASSALEDAIMTSPDAISAETKSKVGLFINPYIGDKS